MPGAWPAQRGEKRENNLEGRWFRGRGNPPHLISSPPSPSTPSGHCLPPALLTHSRAAIFHSTDFLAGLPAPTARNYRCHGSRKRKRVYVGQRDRVTWRPTFGRRRRGAGYIVAQTLPAFTAHAHRLPRLRFSISLSFSLFFFIGVVWNADRVDMGFGGGPASRVIFIYRHGLTAFAIFCRILAGENTASTVADSSGGIVLGEDRDRRRDLLPWKLILCGRRRLSRFIISALLAECEGGVIWKEIMMLIF